MKLDLKSLVVAIVLSVTTVVVCAATALLIYASYKFILPA